MKRLLFVLVIAIFVIPLAAMAGKKGFQEGVAVADTIAANFGSFRGSDGAYRLQLEGANGYNNMEFVSLSTPAPAAGGGGAINFLNAAQGSMMATIFQGAGGATPGNYGGYIVMATKGDGNGKLTESLVLDHNGHLLAPGTAIAQIFTAPASCAALVTCGITTYTFKLPFTTPGGLPEIPACTGVMFQDTTTPSNIWVGNVRTVSSTAVTFNYAPTTAVHSLDTLRLAFTCWDSEY